jgi:hypothetical protein
MGTINELNTTDTLAGDDKLVIWKDQAGATRAITAEDAAAYFSLAGGPYQPLDELLTAIAGQGPNTANGDFIQLTGQDTVRVRKLTVATYAALTVIPASFRFDDMLVYVASRATDGDGGEGWWRFDAASSATANGGTILAPDAGTGRWLRQDIGTLDVRWFGAKGDGTTDDTTAIQAAIDTPGAAGGTVAIPNTMRCLIDTALTVKPNVSLVGPHELVGSPGNNNLAPYGTVGGTLIINSAVTITVQSNASVSGLLVYRKGMTFPAANSSGFAGTAFTTGGDDAAITRCQVFGFNRAILSDGYQRGRFFNLFLDNLNGIRLTDCFDIARIDNVHCWPFATIQQYAIDFLPAQLQRSGTAFDIEGVADWAKLTNCFAYGYFRGFDLADVNTPTLLSCSVDSTPPPNVYAGSRGFSLRGTTYDAKLIGCQAAGPEIGFYLDTGADIQNQLTNCIAWNGSDHAFFVGSGDYILTNCVARQYTNAILYNNAASRLTIRGFQFGPSLTARISAGVTPTTGFIDFGATQAPSVAAGGTLLSGTVNAASLASAQPLLIPATGKDFNISGATNFGDIQAGWAGRQIVLYFAGVLTVVHGTGAATSIRLDGSANFVTAAGSTLSLRHNGTQWYEIGRSA